MEFITRGLFSEVPVGVLILLKGGNKMRKKNILLTMILFFSLGFILTGCQSVSNKDIELIKAGKYEEAAVWLYNENKTLYNYCEAKVSYNKGNYRLGKSYLDSINETYSGPLKEEVINYKLEMKEKNVEYGFQAISDKKYEEAAQWFYELSGKNTNLMKLYSYAQSLKSYSKEDFSMAKIYAEDTAGYSGYGEQEVKEYRDRILNELTPELIASKKAETDAKEKAKAKTEGVRIGMTQEQVRNSNWGNPKSVNRTTGSYGTHEQWVYGGNNYLYFDNGILTTIQN